MSSVPVFPLIGPVRRGARSPLVALVGAPGSGRHSIFAAAASAEVHPESVAAVPESLMRCQVNVGLDQLTLLKLPPITGLHHLSADSASVLKLLLWGDRWPAVAGHEARTPPADLRAPDVLLLVLDATALASGLELALELAELQRPMVIALNHMDRAKARRQFVDIAALRARLGVPVLPTIAHMGMGLAELFTALMQVARAPTLPQPAPLSPHIEQALQPVTEIARRAAVRRGFAMPVPLLARQFAENDAYFTTELAQHFPEEHAALLLAREQASAQLPRPLADEIHADRHHRAALLAEAVARPGTDTAPAWQRAADTLFLHPRWGFVGTLAVFALVLAVVFEFSAWIDRHTVGQLVAWFEPWRPTDLGGVLGRAMLDGVLGLLGIALPYMIPLVMLLALLERSGLMHRVAFVVDRGFHQLGLHGGVALPFLMGLGCNVPALAATAAVTQGRDRIVASLLVTFLPCSARTAILLALGGKYLGGWGVFGLFMLTPLVVSAVGKLLRRRYPPTTPGIVQDIPPYAWPSLRTLLHDTWTRSQDILTIVLPLLLAGSVVLALLSYWGADAAINAALSPLTATVLGLPVALGVPLLFGVLRKELSLLMVFQALGTQELSGVLSGAQIATFLAFLTFYTPCVSTLAMLLGRLGARVAAYSVVLSVGVALAVALMVRGVMALA
ncbi:MAG: ferrous iron transport protein B [Rhodoferax sp.]